MNQQEFEKQWRTCEAKVRAFLAAAGCDATQVVDLAQETALAAWRKREQFEPDRDFLAWVIGMARFCLLRLRRDRARSRVPLAPEVVDRLAETMIAQVETIDRRQVALAACHKELDAAAKKTACVAPG